MMLANTLHVFAGILYQILLVIYLAWLFYFLLSFYFMKKERHLITLCAKASTGFLDV